MSINIINPKMYSQPIQYQQYRKPVYQMSTNNKSFLEMHYFLKSIGVQNNKFMLTLFDTDLVGVDPHDPALPVQTKIKILKEVQCNYWYFIREVVRVPSSGSPRGIPYKLNRFNLAFSFCTMINLNTICEAPRQVGKTMAEVIWDLWIYNFGTTNASMVFMNKQNQDAKRNLQLLKDARDLLPSYLQMAQEYSEYNGKKRRLPSTVTNIQHPFNRNLIRTVPGARNEMGAANLLRGQTITRWWADEWAFTKYNNIIFINGIPALNTAFKNAKIARAPYGISITSTAGILSTPEGKYAYEMIQNATPFNENWYDLTYEQIMDIIHNNMNSDFVYIRFTYKQLGLGEQWFYDICKLMQWDMVAIRREILLEWIDTPENSPFSQDDLEALRGMVREPMRSIMILNKYNFNIYNTIPVTMMGVPIDPPIIGVDVSGGYKRDYTAITVIDSKTTTLIGDLKCNFISIPDLARVLIWMVRNMMPNAVVNIERNGGFGASLISKLKEPGGIKENLYYEIKDRIIEESTDKYGRPIRRKLKTKVYGLDSSKGVRDLLIDILRERMERHKDKFVSMAIFDELSKMVVKRSGKVEHSENSHDDLVFSALMALYVWYEGKNLKENFHINKTTIKTEDSVDDVVGSPDVKGLENKYTEIIEELRLPDDEQEEAIKKMNENLKMLKLGMGITFEQFMAKQKEKENSLLMDMLQNKEVRKAYAKYAQISEQDVNNMINNTQYKLPDTLFTNFNQDPDELLKKEIENNMNFKHFNSTDLR